MAVIPDQHRMGAVACGQAQMIAATRDLAGGIWAAVLGMGGHGQASEQGKGKSADHRASISDWVGGVCDGSGQAGPVTRSLGQTRDVRGWVAFAYTVAADPNCENRPSGAMRGRGQMSP